jgi:putative nucleotidyltransferase with HDIG domain
MILENSKKQKRSDLILNDLFHEFVDALTKAVDARDPYTALHSYRVAEISEILAREMEYKEDFVLWIHIAGHLHDIGKIGIRDSILLKPGKLTSDEMDEIKRHPKVGADIISKVTGLKPIVEIILHHHESWDGKGYPQRLSGEEISPGARIISVADSLDAMLSERPYRPAMSLSAALSEIHSLSGTKYDPRVVEALMKIDIEVIQRLYK